MRESKAFKVWPLFLVALLGLAGMIFFGGPGAGIIDRIVPPADRTGPVLARAVDITGGRVTHVTGPHADNLTAPVDHALELRDGDHFETDGAAEATLVLNSQDELRIKPSSAVSVELWNAADPNSPVYLHVLAGDVAPKRPGVRGRAYVVREGRLYLPGQVPGARAAPLLITRGANALDLNAGEPVKTGDDAADFTAAPDASDAEPKSADDPQTLANEYVDEVIGSRQAQFQKCWLSRLKDKPSLKGALTVQFEITRRGKVRDVKVTDSSLGDDQIGACVATVVERLPFRSFTGPEISVSYPITFE